jgi:hypothetical protein
MSFAQSHDLKSAASRDNPKSRLINSLNVGVVRCHHKIKQAEIKSDERTNAKATKCKSASACEPRS